MWYCKREVYNAKPKCLILDCLIPSHEGATVWSSPVQTYTKTSKVQRSLCNDFNMSAKLTCWAYLSGSKWEADKFKTDLWCWKVQNDGMMLVQWCNLSSVQSGHSYLLQKVSRLWSIACKYALLKWVFVEESTLFSAQLHKMVKM